MTIQSVQAIRHKRVELEKEITRLLLAFQKDTEMFLTEVIVRWVDSSTMEERDRVFAGVEVRIEL